MLKYIHGLLSEAAEEVLSSQAQARLLPRTKIMTSPIRKMQLQLHIRSRSFLSRSDSRLCDELFCKDVGRCSREGLQREVTRQCASQTMWKTGTARDRHPQHVHGLDPAQHHPASRAVGFVKSSDHWHKECYLGCVRKRPDNTEGKSENSSTQPTSEASTTNPPHTHTDTHTHTHTEALPLGRRRAFHELLRNLTSAALSARASDNPN